MITYSEFLDKVKEFEGLRLKAYKCPSGVLTIGYGHTHGVVNGMKITESFAYNLLITDLEICYYQLITLLPQLDVSSVNRALRFVLVDFIFNLGFTKFKNSTLLQVLKTIDLSKPLSSNDVERITIQLLRWVHSNGKFLKGLEARRQWEVSLLTME